MNPGKLKDYCRLLRRSGGKSQSGQQVYSYNEVDVFSGNFREAPSKELLDLNAQIVQRSGTLMIRYYPGMDESLFIEINENSIYSIVGFNHDDNNTKTILALQYVKAPKNG